jgi:hypothetical protein
MINTNLSVKPRLTVPRLSGKIKTSAEIVTVRTKGLNFAWSVEAKILPTKNVMIAKMLTRLMQCVRVAR